MIKLEHSCIIKRHIGEVFMFMTNPKNDVLWQSAVKRVKWTSEAAIGTGTTFQAVFHFMGRRIEFTAEIGAYEPLRNYVYRSTSGSLSCVGSYAFESVEDGTKVDFGVELQTGGGFGLIPDSVLGKMFKRQLESDVKGLKQILEIQEVG